MNKWIKKHWINFFADKYQAETYFWELQINEIIAWYNGENEIWDTPVPNDSDKIKLYNNKLNAILTWLNLHQKPKYLLDLELDKDAFKNLRLLDIGSGPMPCALGFENSEVFCLDPLMHIYIKLGYPIHLYGNTKFINAYSEEIPIQDNFFDAVISVNAIDHVDNLERTAQEIRRVLKPGGKFAMHVHYHKATKTEPLELNDEIFLKLFSWVDNLKKIKESTSKTGFELTDNSERYAVWRNF